MQTIVYLPAMAGQKARPCELYAGYLPAFSYSAAPVEKPEQFRSGAFAFSWSGFYWSFRRSTPANPRRPEPSIPSVPGSGTVSKVIVPPERLAVSVLPRFLNLLALVFKESEPAGSQLFGSANSEVMYGLT